MAKTWKEWYVQDGRIKICRGTLNGMQEAACYEKNSQGTYDMCVQYSGDADVADGLVELWRHVFGEDEEVPESTSTETDTNA